MKLIYFKVSILAEIADTGEIYMDIKEQLRLLAKNSINLEIAGDAEYELGATRFGGQPDVPSDFIWPTYEGKGYDNVVKKRPLSFLAQFNCEKLAKYDKENLLPNHGVLSFFYETISQCWGFDPQDKGCARVYWFEDISSLASAAFPKDLTEDCRFPMLRIVMNSQTSYPSWDDLIKLKPEVESVDDDVYEEAERILHGEESNQFSQLLGWPDVIQNSMFDDCELINQGYFLGRGISDIPKKTLRQASDVAYDRWMLLFQLDTVESKNFELMFGDCGHIYFYITKEDLAARRFDRMWLILQCY